MNTTLDTAYALAQEWKEECAYISRVTDLRGEVKEMGNDRGTFITYCRMARAKAMQQRCYDSAVYIEHCIDVLETLV